ncbi:MAG: hypothetical protein AAF468_22240 [Pseudomonadota bacterium]
MSDIPLVDISVRGPVDGMDEVHPLGEYFHIVMTHKDGRKETFRVSEDAAVEAFWIVGAGIANMDYEGDW